MQNQKLNKKRTERLEKAFLIENADNYDLEEEDILLSKINNLEKAIDNIN